MSKIKICKDCGIGVSVKIILGLCNRCYQKQYREAHREKNKDYQKHWYAINRDRVRKRTGQYAKDNRDKVNAAQKKWHRANPKKASVYAKRWRTIHPEEKRADGERWREKNPAYFKSYREANRDRLLEQDRCYREANPDKVLEGSRRRRTRKISAEGSFTETEFQELLQKYDNQCLCCKQPFTEDNPPQRDHIVPLSKGGTDFIENVQCLCRLCNQRKHTAIIDYRPTEKSNGFEISGQR